MFEGGVVARIDTCRLSTEQVADGRRLDDEQMAEEEESAWC